MSDKFHERERVKNSLFVETGLQDGVAHLYNPPWIQTTQKLTARGFDPNLTKSTCIKSSASENRFGSKRNCIY